MKQAAQNTGNTPSLGIAIDKVGFIILKAREFDAKEGDSDPDEDGIGARRDQAGSAIAGADGARG